MLVASNARHSAEPAGVRRTLADLLRQGRSVALRVRTRRLRCLSPARSRQTFAERLSGVAGTGARRTERLGNLQDHVGLALGGEAGRRLSERLAMPTSSDALLRLIRIVGNDNERPPTPCSLAFGTPDNTGTTACKVQENQSSAAATLNLGAYLRHVLGCIADHPVNRVAELLPWNIGKGHVRTAA